MRTALLLLTLGCGEPKTNAPADTSAQDEDTGRVESPSTWTWTPPDDAPDLALDVVQDAAQQGISAVTTVNPMVLYEAYDEAIGHGNNQCPNPYAATGWKIGWSNDCFTNDGWGFSGRSETAWRHDMSIEGRAIEDYGEFITNALLTSPAGETTGGGTFDMEGYGELWTWTDDDGVHAESWLFGTFRHEGNWLDPSWLDAGASISLTTTSLDQGDGTRVITAQGGISRTGTMPDGTVGLLVDGLTVVQTATGCTASGLLTVQGTGGQRITVDLTEADATDGVACSACGAAMREGEDQGEVCVDLSAMLDWEGRPW